MSRKLRDVILDWAIKHGLRDQYLPVLDNEAVEELAMMVEGVVLDHYAKVLKEPG